MFINIGTMYAPHPWKRLKMAPVPTAGAVTTDGPNYDTYGYRTRVGRRTADATPRPPPGRRTASRTLPVQQTQKIEQSEQTQHEALVGTRN